MSQITDEMISLIKGMLSRGDRQSDIAAYFLINQGRIGDISNAMLRLYSADEAALTRRSRDIREAPIDELPPPGPYPSPYELKKAGNAVWAVRVALEHTKEKIELALAALSNAELEP